MVEIGAGGERQEVGLDRIVDRRADRHLAEDVDLKLDVARLALEGDDAGDIQPIAGRKLDELGLDRGERIGFGDDVGRLRGREAFEVGQFQHGDPLFCLSGRTAASRLALRRGAASAATAGRACGLRRYPVNIRLPTAWARRSETVPAAVKSR